LPSPHLKWAGGDGRVSAGVLTISVLSEPKPIVLMGWMKTQNKQNKMTFLMVKGYVNPGEDITDNLLFKIRLTRYLMQAQDTI
jgi:hypothetical protein